MIYSIFNERGGIRPSTSVASSFSIYFNQNLCHHIAENRQYLHRRRFLAHLLQMAGLLLIDQRDDVRIGAEDVYKRQAYIAAVAFLADIFNGFLLGFSVLLGSICFCGRCILLILSLIHI